EQSTFESQSRGGAISPRFTVPCTNKRVCVFFRFDGRTRPSYERIELRCTPSSLVIRNDSSSPKTIAHMAGAVHKVDKVVRVFTFSLHTKGKGTSRVEALTFRVVILVLDGD
ncbi:unnamed protein product, partial [Ectocarpus sp. 8 AP-2014]